MNQDKAYKITYKTLNNVRKYKKMALIATITIPFIQALLGSTDVIPNEYFCKINDIIKFVNIFAIIAYGLLYVTAEIVMQPMLAKERQKGFLDNSFGTKLLCKPVENYYDNDDITPGAYKLMANCYEGCFFTYNIAKCSIKHVVLKNVALFIIIVVFAYWGYKDNNIIVPTLRLFLSCLFLQELAYHIVFFIQLDKLIDRFQKNFSEIDANSQNIQTEAIFMTLQYETILAYNKSPLSDKVYKEKRDELNEEWGKIKTRYNIHNA